ncbi:replication initiator protein A [Weissella confusa]|uniref:replication initiator protein A n=1 Tax=Weissella confusa TaxID=1583 RepID=UPI001C6FABE7|nr:replication initiator protein A [Weissella confusa]QYU56868.1 replication initiator protein A [Weissella confusa]
MKRISASEANAGRFYQSPKAFVTDDFYRTMSVYAKYLYGILRDRFELSLMNGWVDDNDAIYIYFTIDEIKEVLGVGKNKAIQIKKELQDYDLLEEVSQGLNKPNRLYVGQVVFHRDEASKDADVYKLNPREFKNQTSGGLKIKLQEVYKSNPNDTEFNDTELTKDEEEENDNTRAICKDEQVTNAEFDQIIATEPWLQSSPTWKYLFDWRMENAKGTLELIEVIVNSYWRLRRAEDEGYSRVTTLGTEMALSSAFDKAKRVADENVIDSTQYFGYLSRGLTMQVDKLLLGSSVS